MTADESDAPASRPNGKGRPLEWAVVFHLGALLIAATWAFGGQADWVRLPLGILASLGALITAWVLASSRHRQLTGGQVCAWALPLALFNAVVLASCLNPSMRPVRFGDIPELAMAGGSPRWPSAAVPREALASLWLFDAAWLACFNIPLVLRQRKHLRILLVVAVANALVLSVFGTLQKLAGAKGIYFGVVASPQKYFFSTFVYHNHWGAFMLLMAAVNLALVARATRHQSVRDFFHSPAFTGCVVLLLLVATVPLSASRSSTVLMVALLGLAGVRWLVRLVRRRRHEHESIAAPAAAVIVAALLGAGAIWYLARDTIVPRVRLTLQQIQYARHSRSPDARVELYRDAWSMAMDKRWFGWGMASYPRVFTAYNTRVSVDRLPVFYHDAHSDWLQSLAEHGILGTALLVLTAAIPLLSVGRRLAESPVSVHLLLGCTVVVAYATLEFPFGNYAVVLAWWFCFYAGVRYAQLSVGHEALSR